MVLALPDTGGEWGGYLIVTFETGMFGINVDTHE